MEKWGLVLAGGGGKGAYQIGVWKYLKECGLDRQIVAVSGTSVGALNATLFCIGDYDKAETIWKNIKTNQILTPRIITKKDILNFLKQLGANPFKYVLFGGAFSLLGTVSIGSMIFPIRQIVDASRSMMLQRYNFSRKGLMEIMQEIDLRKIYTSDISCYATCLHMLSLKTHRFDMAQYITDDMKKILLASSAIPIVFDPVFIHGKIYYDGGISHFGDNIPIEPLYKKEIENIIVVYLSQDAEIDREKYKDVRLVEIKPQKDLGGIVSGTLDFSKEGAKWRMNLGYEDAKQILGDINKRN